MPEPAPDVRVDTGVRAGDEVSPFYDPMLAKLIVWGEDRAAACARMLAALAQCEVAGVTTNIAFLERLVAHDAFRNAQLDTGLIDKHRDALTPPAGPTPPRVLAAAAIAEYRSVAHLAQAQAARTPDPYSPWQQRDAWWSNTATHALAFTYADGEHRTTVRVVPGVGDTLTLTLPEETLAVRYAQRDGRLAITVAGETYPASVVAEGDVRHVFTPGARRKLELVDPLAHADAAETHGGHLMAPMSGTVVAVLAKAGDTVAKGAPLLVLEAMKMEHTITAPAAGAVIAVNYAVGDRVAEGADLVDLDVATDAPPVDVAAADVKRP
jgi:3-methylcrotonyl-CoA carboxylase alpha subunit